MSLFLIDGHALAYRSYYAFIKRPLVNSKGEETSAVFGFVKTVMNLVDKYAPSHLAVVFDSAEETFRNDIYEEYKANRPEMPESLASQLPRIFEVLDAMAIPCLALPGYEADDIIATISKKMEGDVAVRIVSGDKDLLQVVTENTHVIRPGKSGLLDEEIDPRGLEGSFGLRPDQFIDYQALRGDPSDNVPGVAGIGEKTAFKLIKEFGTLEAVYENLGSIESKSVRRKLANGKEQAFLSRRLVRLSDDVPIEVSMDGLGRKPFDFDKLRALFEDLEFVQLLETIDQEEREASVERPVDYRTADTEGALLELEGALSRCREFAIDVEASELDSMSAVLAGISVALGEGHAWYVPIKSVIDEGRDILTPPRESPGLPLETVKTSLGPILADPNIKKVGQNIKYDAIVLENAGFTLDGIDFDTMLASYCLNPARRSHGLDSLAKELFGHKMITFKSLFDARTKKKDIRIIPLKTASEYACEDADFTLRIKNVFAPMLDASQVRDLFRNTEMPLSRVLTKMEMSGVTLDVSFLDALSKELSEELAGIEQSIYEKAGEAFNINSTAHLQEILFRKLGLKPSHKTKTGYSTDMEVLKSLAPQHPVPELVLEYRTITKLKNTYIDALPKLVNRKTGRVHTSYNQAVTTTGRLSSSDPNLQNIPIRTPIGRQIRKAFVSRGDDWILVDADYSQIELRIMAHLSRDAELLKAFADDDDVHRRTAARIMGVPPDEVSEAMRSRAKTVNFGIMYGMGARGLAQSLDLDIGEAKKFIDDYFAGYPGVRRFIDETIRQAKRDGAVSTLLGRVRQLPDIGSSDRRARAFAERTAVNTPIQGTAADIIKLAMVGIDKQFERRGLTGRMIMQVHDELLFDVPKAELDETKMVVRQGMERAINLDVPLRVDMGVGRNWLEAHS
ncbi:MAG: DNA polymerase I [Candidatus Latescibacterota bacterium]|nr:MAG: DNA polymerase I [Candidatus Latescibacterota bacterium]